MDTISRDDLKLRMDAGEPMTLVEALPKRYFDAEHLPGAINLPLDALDELAGVALPDKEATIVVYCANTACQNSGIAARNLEAMGYRQVLEYVEGKQDWREAGYALQGGEA